TLRCFPSPQASLQPPRASRPTPGVRGTWCHRLAVQRRLQGLVLDYPTPADRLSPAFYAHRVPPKRESPPPSCFSSMSLGWRDPPVHRDCLAGSTAAGKRRHFVVPPAIQGQRCHRRTAPTQHDIATSPEKTMLYLVGGTDEGQAFVMLRGAP